MFIAYYMSLICRGLHLARNTLNNQFRRKKTLKNFLRNTIITIPGHVSLDRVNVWFQDEARFGQQNTTSKIWAKKGSRPRVVKQQQFLSTHIFGAVCPATGQTEAIIAPYLSKDIMRQHLELISDATPCGEHAVVIVDRASWHMGNVAEGIKNVSVIQLPPYSPELNPVEQVKT
ncbi:IS630 family transposase [Pseudoalteromonas sp. SaAl2]